MKISLLILALGLFPSFSFATSYLITLEKKLDFASVIAHVKVEKIEKERDYAVFTCSVEHTFKGSPKEEVIYRSHSYGMLEPKMWNGITGKEYLVFLHEPRSKGRYWLFEGPRGMRTYGKPYSEWKYDQTDEKWALHDYPHSDYIQILDQFKTTKAEPDGTGQPMQPARKSDNRLNY